MHNEYLLAWTVEAGAVVGPGLLHEATRVTGPLPATVPGSVHVDLIAAGLISDLTVRGRDDEQLWVSQTPWRYRTTIRRPGQPFERAALVFEGIDTLGRVHVGGELRLSTRNMFRRFELDVTADLAAGDEVEVTVDLAPVLPVAQAAELAGPLPRPAAYWRPFNQVRKMACSFSWDWGPATMTAGLWRPVTLHTWTGGRFADVRVTAVPGTGSAVHTVEVEVEVEGRATGVRAVVAAVDTASGVGSDGGGQAATTAPVRGGRARLALEVPGARLWWPHTEGEQPLHDVTVVLLGGGAGDGGADLHQGGDPADGPVLDEHHVRVGFRTIEIDQRPDEAGVGFAVHVNGQRVWVRGFDWIPDDPFPARITAQRYRDRLAQAVAAGANAVRVWGGGIYEADAFYDACDELGLLVIQDFLFACAAYPEDDGTVEEVRGEVRDNVRRLRHRASLAIWCGNNENLWGYEDWGWKAVLDGRPWGQRYYREILPELLSELDGTRPYVPGSPFSPDSPDGTAHHPNDPGRGMQHIWDVWNERDYADYETWRPRFVSEFGYQAPASWPTLVTAIGGPLDPADPQLAHHQRADDGDAKVQAGLDRHLPHPPASGVAWYFATQLLQARAVTTGVNHLRSLHDHCSGALWWQLNDIWPAVSWSVVDVRGRRKLAWHAVRRAFDARLVTIAAGTSGPRIVLVNDTAQPWEERLLVRFASAGTAEVALEQDVAVPPHGSWWVEVDAAGHLGALVTVADVGSRRATRWLVGDTELVLPAPETVVTATPAEPDGAGATRVTVTVTTATLLRDVSLLTELALPDAVVTGQLATLLAGESTAFEVRLPAGADGSASGASSRDVDWDALLWSDNRLRHHVTATSVATATPTSVIV